jgi:Restriction endonuclease
MSADSFENDPVLEQLRDAFPGWKPDVTLELGEISWRPHLVDEVGKALLYVHRAERLRSYIVDRIAAAVTHGYQVHLATSIATLYDEQALQDLVIHDSIIHLLDAEPKQPAHVIAVLADVGIQVSPETRTKLGRRLWELSQQDGSKAIRGRRFEAAIAFLLSQVADFNVVERNLRTETEELDAVVQQRATTGRCWATIGAPFIIVEGKNWKTKVPQREISVLRVKLEGRRGTARIGLIFGAGGFTSDALDQEMRFASGDLTIVCIGPDELQGWIESEDGDKHLEGLVRRAMLR